MFAKLLLKVANIIKREKSKLTIIANPSIVEPTCIQIQPSTITPPITPPITQSITPTIAPTITERISVKSQCKTCVGCGFVKTDSIICHLCNGRKCMHCNSIGLTQLPWSECPTCYGSGEIMT
jgi:hypothetical protein